MRLKMKRSENISPADQLKKNIDEEYDNISIVVLIDPKKSFVFVTLLIFLWVKKKPDLKLNNIST